MIFITDMTKRQGSGMIRFDWFLADNKIKNFPWFVNNFFDFPSI